MQFFLEIFFSIFVEFLLGYTGAGIKVSLRHGPHKLSITRLHQELERGARSCELLGLVFFGTLIVFAVVLRI